ncbi:diacylglycerol kinase [Litchfieldella qijiaojingensis]|uniref:Diacylglycerol kinase n=1 Tax=Litchfieldella qijiaojingensis TaxID=980347 RepID=A0ABQ2YL69_9GAMM|nr:diacylglycerol kinase [Halomonas qijiaojingensis]GGX85928.1 diacylglycerol kinase [Halomonas qijiaojingensis]
MSSLDPSINIKTHKRTGLKRLSKAIKYSCAGLSAAWRYEAAFRQELVALSCLFPITMVLDLEGVERALLWASMLLVIVVELLNSAIEATVDRIGMEHHPISGLAKDLGSAAVMVSLLLAGGSWACVLLS